MDSATGCAGTLTKLGLSATDENAKAMSKCAAQHPLSQAARLTLRMLFFLRACPEHASSLNWYFSLRWNVHGPNWTYAQQYTPLQDIGHVIQSGQV